MEHSDFIVIYWLSTERMTVGVETENGIVTVSPPITRKFIGQPIDSLIRWMKKQSGFLMVMWLKK